MHAQGGAESVQIVIAGFTTDGSSSVPARRIKRCGRLAAALVTGVPQRVQNCRVIRLPLSAALSNAFSGPVSRTASAAKTTFTVPLPAAKYWQSRHQHIRVAIGSEAAV